MTENIHQETSTKKDVTARHHMENVLFGWIIEKFSLAILILCYRILRVQLVLVSPPTNKKLTIFHLLRRLLGFLRILVFTITGGGVLFCYLNIMLQLYGHI